MERITEEQIKRLRVLLDESTPGPYEARRKTNYDDDAERDRYWGVCGRVHPRLDAAVNVAAFEGDTINEDEQEANAELYAESHNALPALLDELEQCWEVIRVDIGVCPWTEDEEGIWKTGCGDLFVFTDGGPTDNNMRYCPYCGKQLHDAAAAAGRGGAGDE